MFIFYLTFGNFCFIWVFITFHAEKTGIYHKNGDFLRKKYEVQYPKWRKLSQISKFLQIFNTGYFRKAQ